MIDLPLFPLNIVLFPGIPIQLHIFEERYKKMINQCVDAGEAFGVVLIKQGTEALGSLAAPHTVGCTAQIVQVKKLSMGRMNITVIGQERFRIFGVNREQPFLIGQVELAPFLIDDPEEVQRAGARLRPLVRRYFDVLAKAGDESFAGENLPENPLELAYLAAYMVQAPLQQKQKLLAENQALGLLKGLGNLYPLEIALLEAMMAGGKGESADTFSLN